VRKIEFFAHRICAYAQTCNAQRTAQKGERNEKKNDGSSINNGNDSRCAWWMWKQHGK
jgi:hypothetical protein